MNQIGVYYEGYKIIEIGVVEVINCCLIGNNFYVYLKLDWLVDLEVFGVYGIVDEFLLDKLVFVDVVDEFFDYICGVELVIYNVLFDIGFMDYEFGLFKCDIFKINIFCKVIDSLVLVWKMFFGKCNSFDVLCLCYEIDNSKCILYGVLFDVQIFVEVYLVMMGG